MGYLKVQQGQWPEVMLCVLEEEQRIQCEWSEVIKAQRSRT